MFSKYHILLRVIELGSLTAAANEIGYTQSAVSQTIRSLENELGITLLIRNRTGLTVTSECRQILPYIRQIMKLQGEVDERILDMKNLCSGEISIGAYHLVACNILPELIRLFQQDYPDVHFKIMEGDSSEIHDWISSGTVDFGFLAIQDIRDMETIPFSQEQMCIVLPSSLPEASEDTFDLMNIEQYPFIYLDEGSSNDCAEIFRKNNIKPHTAYTVKEDATVLGLVEKGLGISFLTELAGENSAYDVKFLPTFPAYYRTIGIAIKDRKTASTAVKRFLTFIEGQRK
jgi:DNA-binding transcriptional LysR family regulator